jgi:hypothetical protein
LAHRNGMSADWGAPAQADRIAAAALAGPEPLKSLSVNHAISFEYDYCVTTRRRKVCHRAHPAGGVNFNQSGMRSGLHMPAVTYAKTARITTNLAALMTSTPADEREPEEPQ